MSEEPKPQLDKFRDLARELECDDDEEAVLEGIKLGKEQARGPLALRALR